MEGTFTAVDWDRYAQWYDSLNELRPYVRMLDDVANMLRGTGCTILDAGCGTGTLTSRLIRAGKTVIGIDASAAMLKHAKAKCPGTTFLQADLDHRLPFKARSFEAVVCVNALYALKDPEATLREFSRILRPHGHIVLVTPKLGYENGLILKSHCESPKADAYWLNAHQSAAREEFLLREAITDSESVERLLWIARFNRVIAFEKSFHFFTPTGLSEFAQESGFADVMVKETYASQNLLLVATRSHKMRIR